MNNNRWRIAKDPVTSWWLVRTPRSTVFLFPTGEQAFAAFAAGEVLR